MAMSKLIHRPIRSFVLRQGRMTGCQQRALSEFWPAYGLAADASNPYDWVQIFGRDAKRILEIGFGMGNSLLEQAVNYPHIDFIGIEVHQPGVGRCIATAQDLGLTNLKIFAHDAIAVLDTCIGEGSIDKVQLFFPDPWPKKKHHKRRIVQPAFVMLIAQKLKSQGLFHLATDWQPYADHMLSALDHCPVFANYFAPHTFAPSQFERPQTKFEQRGEKLGHQIWDLVFKRQ